MISLTSNGFLQLSATLLLPPPKQHKVNYHSWVIFRKLYTALKNNEECYILGKLFQDVKGKVYQLTDQTVGLVSTPTMLQLKLGTHRHSCFFSLSPTEKVLYNFSTADDDYTLTISYLRVL